MDNFLSGGIAELEQARKAFESVNSLAADVEESERLLRSNEKDLEAQKKFMNDKIEAAIRNRREELVRAHDEQINGSKKEQRTARKDRKTARAKAVNERISDETAALVAENNRLRSQANKLLKEAKVPTIFNSSYYFSLFHAKTARDFLVFALTVLIAIAVIPNVVCLLINTTTFIKILIYVGIIVVFMGIYFCIFMAGKGEAREIAIEKVRLIRKRMTTNKKHIRLTSNGIRSDGDESAYELEGFDAEIERIGSVIAEKESAKEAALKQFDSETAVSIKSEIEKDNAEAIEKIQVEGTALKAELQQKQASLQSARTEIADTYASYLGAKHANVESVNALINIINEGKATTIMQALDVLNSGI